MFTGKVGLGTAAKRDVGTGENQIPDMSSFSLLGASTSGGMRFPNGFKIVWGPFSLPEAQSGTQTVTFYSAFPTTCISVIPIPENASTEQIGYLNKSKTSVTIKKGSADVFARPGIYIALGY